MSSSGERGSPLRGMRGGGGVRGEGIPLGKSQGKEGTRRGNVGRKEDGVFFHREGRKGKRVGLRSHREVAREAEVRAVAAKEDPPTGGCEEGEARGRGVGDSEGRGGFLGKRGVERGGGEIGGDGRRGVFPAGERDWGVKQRAGAKRKMEKRKDGRLCYTEKEYKSAREGLPWPP